MRIQTFKNKKGLIHGSDPMRIGCDLEGTLKIGTTEVSVSPEADSVMPLLFHGCTGVYEATFTAKGGEVYELDKVAVRGGRIVPPPATAIELMELRCRADEAEDERDELRKQMNDLANIFDTNSLNFLIR
jgi:hypothetical protein